MLKNFSSSRLTNIKDAQIINLCQCLITNAKTSSDGKIVSELLPKESKDGENWYIGSAQ